MSPTTSTTSPSATPAPFSRRAMLVAFVLCIVITNAFALGALSLLERARESGESVLHAALTIAQLERVHKTVLASESARTPAAGSRAQPTGRGVSADVEKELARLTHLTADHAEQGQHASRLAADIASHYAQPSGPSQLQQIGARISRMQKLESDLLESRKQQSFRSERDLRIALAMMALAALVMIVALFWRMDRLWALWHRAPADSDRQAYHDGLTGLPNRRLLKDRLDMALAHARRVDQQIAVVAADFDGFSQVNEEHGKRIGDEVLKEAGVRLQRLCRDADTVARTSADDFYMVLSDVKSDSDVAAFAQRLINSLSAPYFVDGHEVAIGAAVGTATFSGQATSADDLLRRAAAALHDSKRAGSMQASAA